MPSLTLTIPRPHPTQQTILTEARRYNVLACGRRWGKSTIAINLAAEPLLNGGRVGWFAPSYKLMLDSWRDVERILRPITTRSNAQDRRMEFITGGVLEFWTLVDKDAGRSRKYHRVIIDEAGLVSDLKETWQAAIRPTLADYAGDAWLAGTPKGHNFFWKCFNQGQDPLQPEWASWQRPTWTNPYIKASEIDAMRREMTDRRFAQEVEAQFLEDGGGVFRGVAAVSTAAPQERPVEGHQYIIGADWGKRADYTVFSVWDATARREVWLDRSNGVEYAIQEQRLAALAARYGVTAIYAEENSMGGPIIEHLRRRDLPVRPFTTTNASKAAIIDALALALEQQSVTLLNDPTATAEMLAFEATRLPSGLMRYAAPENGHDDTVMARALAYEGARRPSGAGLIDFI